MLRNARIAFRLGAIGAGVAAVAMSNFIPAAASTGGGPIAASVLGSGSDTTQFMMQGLDGLYLFSPGCQQLKFGSTTPLDFSCQSPDPAGTMKSENYAHDQVHQAYFLGSGGGLSQLCSQGQAGIAYIDYARSSATPTSANCTGLHAVAYARDAISWEAFNITGSGVAKPMNNQSTTCAGSSGITRFCLSQAQLQGIFITCTITNWSQVGGSAVAISIYTPQPNSGTRKTWDKFLGGDSSHCIPAAQLASHQIPENSNTGIPAANQKGAIFPFSFGVWTTQVHGTGGAILGAVDKILPTAGTIANLTFPYGRFLYNVYCGSNAAGTCGAGTGHVATTQTTNYVGEQGWICKINALHATNPVTGNNYRVDIQNAITAAGFVPETPGVIGSGNNNHDYCRLTIT
jgi:ABC-type phosphate transport system substrate-binding protein